jgi:hypothetical protein
MVLIKEYRENIANTLNIDFNDDGIRKVGLRGSSFDGECFEIDGRTLGVLDRWWSTLITQLIRD